jgi:putative ABC transport system permease protein
MRKVMAALVTLLLVLLLFLSSKVVEQYQFHQLLYDGRTGMMLNFDDFKRKENPNGFIEKVAKDSEVGIAKYSYKDSKHIQVFTTDPTLGGRIRLAEGSYPAARSGEFISTKTTDTSAQVGRFTSGESQIMINLFLLDHQKQASPNGVYYFDTKDQDKIQQIIQWFAEEQVTTEIMDVTFQPLVAVETMIKTSAIVMLAMFALFLSILGAMTFEIVHKKREILVMKLHGYTWRATVWGQWRKWLPAFSTAVAFSYLSFFSYRMFAGDPLNFLPMTLLFLVAVSLCALVFAGTSGLLIRWMYHSRDEYEGLKGKKPYQLLMSVSFILTIVFLVFSVGALSFLQHTNERIARFEENLSIWEKTENLYRTVISYIGQNNVRAQVADQQNQAVKKAYQELNEKVDGFLMDSSNYHEVADGVYAYDLNTKEGEDVRTNPSGKTITINENYLSYNPIESEHGSIRNQLKKDENVLNLLVPVSLREKETEIKENFISHFYFQKVEVENIYREDKGEPLNTMTKADLDVNIIYVKDNQSYFTFNPYEEGEGDYFIRDPIAIIDQASIDASYYMSYLGRSYYFYSDEEDPLQTFRPIAAANNASALQRVESVYDAYGKTIQELSATRAALITVIAALSIAALSVSLYYTLCFFHKNKLKLFVQHIHGQGFYSLTRGLLLMHGCLFIVLLGLSFLLQLGGLTWITVAMLVLNIGASVILVQYLTNRLYPNMKKEL